MLSFGVNTIEPIAPHGVTVPSFSIFKSTPHGLAPQLIYPFGDKHAVSPHEFSLYVLNLSLLSMQYCLLAFVALIEFLNQSTLFSSFKSFKFIHACEN